MHGGVNIAVKARVAATTGKQRDIKPGGRAMGVASLGKDGLHGNTAAGNDHDSGSKKGADRPLLFTRHSSN
jgi:hypothetical protein